MTKPFRETTRKREDFKGAEATMVSLRLTKQDRAMLDVLADGRTTGRWIRIAIRRAYSRLPAERRTAGDDAQVSNQRARVANSVPER